MKFSGQIKNEFSIESKNGKKITNGKKYASMTLISDLPIELGEKNTKKNGGRKNEITIFSFFFILFPIFMLKRWIEQWGN